MKTMQDSLPYIENSILIGWKQPLFHVDKRNYLLFDKVLTERSKQLGSFYLAEQAKTRCNWIDSGWVSFKGKSPIVHHDVVANNLHEFLLVFHTMFEIHPNIFHTGL
jgi:hypothetical protein